jgi:hypothetical protein
VGFLRVFGLGLPDARLLGQEFLAEAFGDQRARRAHRFARQRHAVGAHVGDEAHGLAADVETLVELLGKAHRARGAKTELARGFLLQRRGGEGRHGIAPHALALDARDRIGIAAFDLGDGRLGGGLACDVELVETRAVELRQARVEFLAALGGELGADGPVFACAEPLDFVFAFADQPQRHRLHAARRAAAGKLAPQDRREVEAHEKIEGAAREIRIDQIAVEVARMAHGLEDRGFCDLVEHDAAHVDVFELVCGRQHLFEVPGNRFALAVGVGRQNKGLDALKCPRDLGNGLFGAFADFPMHFEVAVRLYGAVFFAQIAHVPVRCEDAVLVAEIFVDGFRLRRRFHDNELHPPACRRDRAFCRADRLFSAKPDAKPGRPDVCRRGRQAPTRAGRPGRRGRTIGTRARFRQLTLATGPELAGSNGGRSIFHFLLFYN